MEKTMRTTILALTALLGLSLATLSITAQFSVILTGGEVHITELEGLLEYTKAPFNTWNTTLNVQRDSEWRARLFNLTVDYTGSITITWSLYQQPSSTLRHSFNQTTSIVSGVPQNIVASNDGGSTAFNWGAFTSSSNVTVYIETDINEV